jgi:hypothetical protein
VLRIRRGRIVRDQVGFDRFVGVEKWLHVHDEVFQHLVAHQRLNRGLSPQVLHQEGASQPVSAIDPHRVGAAHAVGAGAAVGERPVLIPFHLVEGIEQPVGRLDLDLVLLEHRLDVLFRVVALDPQGDFHGMCSSNWLAKGGSSLDR